MNYLVMIKIHRCVNITDTMEPIMHELNERFGLKDEYGVEIAKIEDVDVLYSNIYLNITTPKALCITGVISSLLYRMIKMQVGIYSVTTEENTSCSH